MSYGQPVLEDCVNHPGYAAAGTCPACGQVLCPVCLAAHAQDPERYCPAAVPPLPEPRRSTSVLGAVAWLLFLALAGLVIAGVVYYNRETAPPANTLAAPEPSGPAPPSAAPLAPLTPAPPAPPAGSAREEAAKEVALQGKPGWVAKINSHEPDWSQVVVWIGPAQNDLRLARTLTWEATVKAYSITQEGPVPQPPPTALPPAPAPAPATNAPPASGPAPGREAALRAALANDPGYEAKIVSHSADWKKVTVDTGLPLQPLSHEYRFHWDDSSQQYIVDRMGPLGRRRRGG
jgi:hypothetical protein